VGAPRVTAAPGGRAAAQSACPSRRREKGGRGRRRGCGHKGELGFEAGIYWAREWLRRRQQHRSSAIQRSKIILLPWPPRARVVSKRSLVAQSACPSRRREKGGRGRRRGCGHKGELGFEAGIYWAREWLRRRQQHRSSAIQRSKIILLPWPPRARVVSKCSLVFKYHHNRAMLWVQ
jgi:hypothetical protein